ncbi:MAG: DUF2125 domain-containing protein [Roseovarius sp.]
MTFQGTHTRGGKAATRAATSALALMMGTGGAMADVTPAEVWADWQRYMGSFDMAVNAQETQTDEGLELADITLTQTLPDDAGETVITVPEIVMRDNGDGTVAIVYPAEMPISIAGKGLETYTLEMLYRTTDMVSTVSGDASEMTYDYSASGLGLTATGLEAEGETVDLGEIRFDLENLKGRTVMTLEEGRTANQQVMAGPASYTFDVSDPEGGDTKIAGQFETLEMMGKLVMPEGVDANEMSAALASGFAIDGGYVFGPGSSTFEATSGGNTTSGSTSSEGGKLTMRMDEEGLAYGVTSQGLKVEALVPPLPFAVSMAMEETEFDLAVPLTQAEEPQDFALNLLLGGLTLSDTAWSMIDGQNVLPRDPATVALDVDGKASILADIMDPAQMAQVEEQDDIPAQLDALTLNSLLVSLVGAELTGEGAVTFDNTDTESYGGQPKPVGAASFTLTGANTLLDRLVSMGMLGSEQAMMARMTLGMAAVPGDGEDVLKSEIEFTEAGGIIANGQQLK